MVESVEQATPHSEIMALLHGIESNTKTLQALRKIPGFLSMEEQALEEVIQAQKKLLGKMLE